MKRSGFSLLVAMAAALLAPAGHARAGDGGADARIGIRAPLDSTACDQEPPIIRVLGLAIDISRARFEPGEEAEPGGDESPEIDSAAGCERLVEERAVEVKLRDDSAPLFATAVAQEGVGDEIRIKAPIQAVSEDLQTITLLGLRIDVSSVSLETLGGDEVDEEAADDDPARRLLGKVVEADLDPGSLPWLVAAGVEFEAGEEPPEEVEEQEEVGWLNPVGSGTLFEFVEVFTPTFVRRAPKHTHGSRQPHFRRPPHPRPVGTVGPPAMRVAPAPGLTGSRPSR